MHKNITNGVLVVVVLLFGYYTISPFFKNIEIDDVLPDNFTARTNEEKNVLIPSGFENLSKEKQIELITQIADVNKTPSTKMNDVMSDTIEVNTIEDMVEVVIEETQYPVMGTIGHPADGFVRIVETQEGTIIRYEDFSTINGPNLHLYLSKDLQANDFIDLGPIRGTSGNINYVVPEGIDISEYRYVMYWCVPFKVLFNYAEIN